jgi:hypothetical protein
MQGFAVARVSHESRVRITRRGRLERAARHHAKCSSLSAGPLSLPAALEVDRPFTLPVTVPEDSTSIGQERGEVRRNRW